MKTGVAVVAMLLCFLPISARAEISAGEFLAKHKTHDAIGRSMDLLVINAVYIGMAWAGGDEFQRYETRPFCVPDKLAPTKEQLLSILQRYVDQNEFAKDYPMGAVLLYALKDVFPCPSVAPAAVPVQ